MYKKFLIETLSKVPLKDNTSSDKIRKLKSLVELMTEEESERFLKEQVVTKVASAMIGPHSLQFAARAPKYIKKYKAQKIKDKPKKKKGVKEQYSPKTNTAMDVSGVGMGAATAALTANPVAAAPSSGMFLLFRILKAQKDNCIRTCGEFSFNTPKRQLCLAKCHLLAAQREVVGLQNERNKCAGNPTCIQQINNKIQMANAKLKKAQLEFRNLSLYRQQKGKEGNPEINMNKRKLFRSQ